MPLRFLLVVLLALAGVAAAQETPDAGLPDAAVGEGGADRDTEEGDGTGGACLDSRSCSTGFSCVNGRCVPTPVKNVGCRVGPALAVLAAVFALRRARRA